MLSKVHSVFSVIKHLFMDVSFHCIALCNYANVVPFNATYLSCIVFCIPDWLFGCTHQILSVIIFIIWVSFDFWNKSSRLCSSHSSFRGCTGFRCTGNSKMAEQGIVLKSHVTVLEMCQEHSVHSTRRLLLFSCCCCCCCFLSLCIVSTGYSCWKHCSTRLKRES